MNGSSKWLNSPFCLGVLFQMPTWSQDIKFIFFPSQRPMKLESNSSEFSSWANNHKILVKKLWSLLQEFLRWEKADIWKACSWWYRLFILLGIKLISRIKFYSSPTLINMVILFQNLAMKNNEKKQWKTGRTVFIGGRREVCLLQHPPTNEKEGKRQTFFLLWICRNIYIMSGYFLMKTGKNVVFCYFCSPRQLIMKSIYTYEVNTTFSESNFQSDIDKKLGGVGLGFAPSFFTWLNCKSNGPTSGQRCKKNTCVRGIHYNNTGVEMVAEALTTGAELVQSRNKETMSVEALLGNDASETILSRELNHQQRFSAWI